MTFEKFNEEFPWMLIVIDKDDHVVHLCGYTDEPTNDTAMELNNELMEDIEFDLMSEASNFELTYYPSPTSECQKYYDLFVGAGGVIVEQDE